MNRWVMRNMAKLNAEDMREFSKMGTESLQGVPTVIWKPMLASYMAGQGFLSIGRRQLRRAEKIRDPNAVLERAGTGYASFPGCGTARSPSRGSL